MPRLFVAIELPEDVRERLAGLCNGLPGARWVPPENQHLTLRFIGEIPASEMPDLIGALARITAPNFALSISGVGFFGQRKRARLAWAGVEKNPALIELQRRVEAAVQRAGLPVEERKFSPHITLARLKVTRPDRLGGWMEAHNLFRAGPFPVTRFVLFSSFLSQSGAIYTAEAEFDLKTNS